ncbi:tryptophan--tRNA ligase [Candidatus Bipolaricaulota bacterium]|nr:tryptophan--tRNA ligase [Candidatus Bipolaricaulota bacterium]TFH09123.1 MAG: tryptophan--tRNA ligase [Candidatus Atribacteria bacterium]
MTRVFSGIQPTGTLHIGNYFGAVRNWAAMQDDIESIICIVDYHAITIDVDPTTLRQATLSMATDLIACGIDPEKTVLFVQSDVPEHTELGWILGCVTSIGDLSRMTQFKDKSSKQSFISSGLFTYPVLQAADILLYKADGVPVGEDQIQHLELSRRIARRFNSRFGEFFPEPQQVVGEKGARIMSLSDPTAKMSKSAGETHYVGVMEPETSIRKKVRSAVTDMGLESGDAMSPGVANLFEILELSTESTGQTDILENLRANFAVGSLMYSTLKDAVFEQLMEILRPIQEKRAKLESSGDVIDMLRSGAKRARIMAKETIAQVRPLVGLGTDNP